MLSLESREAPSFYLHKMILWMFDSPTVTETFSSNFALRWDAKTLTSDFSVFSLIMIIDIYMHPGYYVIQAAFHTTECLRVSNIICELD